MVRWDYLERKMFSYMREYGVGLCKLMIWPMNMKFQDMDS